MLEQDVADHPVTRFGQFLVIQSQIHINATDMALLALRDEHLGNPAAHQHHVVPILTEDVRQLDEHRPGRFHGGGGVVYAFSGHDG